MLYLVIAVLVAVAVAVAVAVSLLRKPNRLDEVDRFRTARSLTTSWSSGPAVRVVDAGTGAGTDAGTEREPGRD